MPVFGKSLSLPNYIWHMLAVLKCPCLVRVCLYRITYGIRWRCLHARVWLEFVFTELHMAYVGGA